MNEERRIVLAPMLRQLAEEALQHRARLAPNDPNRQFFLGVDAAVEAFLHPEAAGARHPSWLDRETAAFQEGYRATIAEVINVAISTAVVPLRLPLPAPPPEAGILQALSP